MRAGGIVATIVLLCGALLFLEEKIALLHVGDRAPDFSALAQTGERIRLSEFAGRKNIVLYFYPKDYTAGCTEQACSFRDRIYDVTKFDAVILGVSSDDAQSHRMFASSYNLPFLLLSDPEKTIIKAYGARWFGGLLPVTKRVTYVIDKSGTIAGLHHGEIKMSSHVDSVIEILRRLNGPTTE